MISPHVYQRQFLRGHRPVLRDGTVSDTVILEYEGGADMDTDHAITGVTLTTSLSGDRVVVAKMVRQANGTLARAFVGVEGTHFLVHQAPCGQGGLNNVTVALRNRTRGLGCELFGKCRFPVCLGHAKAMYAWKDGECLRFYIADATGHEHAVAECVYKSKHRGPMVPSHWRAADALAIPRLIPLVQPRRFLKWAPWEEEQEVPLEGADTGTSMLHMHGDLWVRRQRMMEFSEKFTELLGSQDLVLHECTGTTGCVCEKW